MKSARSKVATAEHHGARLRTAASSLATAIALISGCGGGGGASDAATAVPVVPVVTVPAAPSGTAGFALVSAAGSEGGTLPAEYTCDGTGASPPLAWTGAPAGTRTFALLMGTLPGDGTTKYNWVVYNLPASASSLPKSNFGALYALSAAPALGSGTAPVDGATLSAALAPLRLGERCGRAHRRGHQRRADLQPLQARRLSERRHQGAG